MTKLVNSGNLLHSKPVTLFFMSGSFMVSQSGIIISSLLEISLLNVEYYLLEEEKPYE